MHKVFHNPSNAPGVHKICGNLTAITTEEYTCIYLASDQHMCCDAIYNKCAWSDNEPDVCCAG